VLPISVVILIALFLVQNRGTARVALFFGPVTAVWFVVLAGVGVHHRSPTTPEVLAALNPAYGLGFIAEHGEIGLVDARRGLPRR
jgi:KUP system potassium uptake protein